MALAKKGHWLWSELFVGRLRAFKGSYCPGYVLGTLRWRRDLFAIGATNSAMIQVAKDLPLNIVSAAPVPGRVREHRLFQHLCV